ncbi:MAG TPA: hypothetical protein VMU04_17625 [Candidatus Acidoferrum sp.]|nr:hypothetical protein [Candidatus Acidoferrum sp.]
MNRLMVTVCAAALSLGTGSLLAQNNNNGQGRPNRGYGDPAAFQQRLMDNLKEDLEITDDQEWKAIQPMIQKVFDLRRQTMPSMRAIFGRNRGGGQGDSGRPRGGPFGGTPSPEMESLQKAIDSKASNSEMKAAIAKYQEARKAKQAELEKAQDDLRKVLTVRQEAVAISDGLL